MQRREKRYYDDSDDSLSTNSNKAGREERLAERAANHGFTYEPNATSNNFVVGNTDPVDSYPPPERERDRYDVIRGDEDTMSKVFARMDIGDRRGGYQPSSSIPPSYHSHAGSKRASDVDSHGSYRTVKTKDKHRAKSYQPAAPVISDSRGDDDDDSDTGGVSLSKGHKSRYHGPSKGRRHASPKPRGSLNRLPESDSEYSDTATRRGPSKGNTKSPHKPQSSTQTTIVPRESPLDPRDEIIVIEEDSESDYEPGVYREHRRPRPLPLKPRRVSYEPVYPRRYEKYYVKD